MATIHVQSKAGGVITIDTDALQDILDRWNTTCSLAARLCNEMEDDPTKAAAQFDTEELKHHAVSDYTNEMQQELKDIIASLGGAFSEYAESVIGDCPENFNAIEIHGVREDAGICDVDETKPHYYSVYVHLISGGIDCVGDYQTRGHAKQYADKLANRYGWPVRDFVCTASLPPDRVGSVMIQDVVGEYDVPTDIPEWSWIEKQASYKHVHNGEPGGVWEFILNLSRQFTDVPEGLKPIFKQAIAENKAYLLFHQGT